MTVDDPHGSYPYVLHRFPVIRALFASLEEVADRLCAAVAADDVWVVRDAESHAIAVEADNASVAKLQAFGGRLATHTCYQWSPDAPPGNEYWA